MSSIAIIGRPAGIRLRHTHWKRKVRTSYHGGGPSITAESLREETGTPRSLYKAPTMFAMALAVLASPFQRVFGRRKV